MDVRIENKLSGKLIIFLPTSSIKAHAFSVALRICNLLPRPVIFFVLFVPTGPGSVIFDCDGVQDMIPPNMAALYSDYFKVKEFERKAEAGRSLRPPPSLLKQVITPSRERGLPCTRRKKRPYLQDKGT